VESIAKHEKRSAVLRAPKARFSALWPADRWGSNSLNSGSLVVVKTARTEKRNENGSQKHEKVQEYEVAQKGQEVGSY